MILADIVTCRTRPDNTPTDMLRFTLPLVALAAGLLAIPGRAQEVGAKSHWAFKAPVRPAAPEIRN